MSKLLLLASLAMMIALPIRAARVVDAKRGLRSAVATTLLFNIGWAAVVLVVFLYLLQNPASLFPESVNQ